MFFIRGLKTPYIFTNSQIPKQVKVEGIFHLNFCHTLEENIVNTVAYFRATTVNFWQASPPQWWPHQWRAVAFYSAKSRQGLGFGDLASSGGPVLNSELHPKRFEVICLSKNAHV